MICILVFKENLWSYVFVAKTIVKNLDFGHSL